VGKSLWWIEVDYCDCTPSCIANSTLKIEMRLQTDDRIRGFETVNVGMTVDILVSWQRAIDRAARRYRNLAEIVG